LTQLNTTATNNKKSKQPDKETTNICTNQRKEIKAWFRSPFMPVGQDTKLADSIASGQLTQNIIL